MANKKIWLGILVMMLIFGMAVVGCDDDSTSSSGGSLDGTTWAEMDMLGNPTDITITFSGSNYTLKKDGATISSGTYTLSSDGRDLKFTETSPGSKKFEGGIDKSGSPLYHDYFGVNCMYEKTKGHTHSYAATWSKNATQHWHECSCRDKKDLANHSGNPCSVCSYDNGNTSSLLKFTDNLPDNLNMPSVFIIANNTDTSTLNWKDNTSIIAHFNSYVKPANVVDKTLHLSIPRRPLTVGDPDDISSSDDPWTDSGTYAIYIAESSSSGKIITDVVFTNGSATLSLSGFTNVSN
jgi:hypothetical protein